MSSPAAITTTTATSTASGASSPTRTSLSECYEEHCREYEKDVLRLAREMVSGFKPGQMHAPRDFKVGGTRSQRHRNNRNLRILRDDTYVEEKYPTGSDWDWF